MTKTSSVLNGMILAGIIFGANLNAIAVELAPTEGQIDQAVQGGQAAVGKPLQVRNLFGTMGDCGWGFLQTKLWNIWAGSYEAARKLKPYTAAQIQGDIQNATLLITYSLCSEQSDEREAHVVLKQGEKVIQPTKVSTGHPETTSKWPNSPAYNVSVTAHFGYGSFDPSAMTTIIVVPRIGDRLQYDVNLADML